MSNRSDVSPSRGRFLGSLGQIFKKKEPETEATPMILGKEGNFKYDPIKKKYIFLDEPEQEDEDIPKPPPKAAPKEEQKTLQPLSQTPQMKQESVKEDLCKPAGHLALHRMKRNQPQPAQTIQRPPQQSFIPSIPKIEVNKVEEPEQEKETKNQQSDVENMDEDQREILEDLKQYNDIQIPQSELNQQKQHKQFLKPEPQSMAEVSFDTKQQSSPPVSKQRSYQPYERENIVKEIVDSTYQQIIQINIPPLPNGKQSNEINLNQFISLDHHYYPEEVHSEPLSLTSDLLRTVNYMDPIPVASHSNLFIPQNDEAFSENLQYLRKVQIQNYQSAIQELQEENEGCYVIIEQLTKDLNSKGQIIDNQNHVISELIHKLHEFNSHYETLKPQLEQFKEDKILQTKQKQALQNQLFEIQIELKNSRKECEFYQEQYKHQLKERSSYQKYYEEIRKEMQEDIMNLTQKLEESKVSVNDVHAFEIENSQLKSELELLKSEYLIYQQNQNLIHVNYQQDIKETIEQDLKQLKSLFNLTSLNVDIQDTSSLEIRKQLFGLQKVLVKHFKEKEITHNQELEQLKQQLSSSHNQGLQAQRNLQLLQQQMNQTDKIFQQIKQQLEYKLEAQSQELLQLEGERDQLKELVRVLKNNQQAIQDLLTEVTNNHNTTMNDMFEQIKQSSGEASQGDQIQMILENLNHELSHKKALQEQCEEVEKLLQLKSSQLNQSEEELLKTQAELKGFKIQFEQETSKNDKFEESLNLLQSVIDEIQPKYDELEIQYNQSKQKIEQLNEQNLSLTNEKLKFVQEIESLRQLAISQEITHQELRSQILYLENSLSEANQILEKLQVEYKTSSQTINNQAQEINDLQQQIQSSKEELLTQQQEIEKTNFIYEQSLEELKQQSKSLIEQIQILTQENQSLNEKIRQEQTSQELMNELESINQSLTELIQQNTAQQEKIEELNTKNQQNEEQIESLKAQVKEEQKNRIKAQEDLAQVSSELENCLYIQHDGKKINDELRERLELIDNQSSEELTSLREEQRELKVRYQEIEERNQMLQSQIRDRDDKLEQMINLVEELNSRPDEKESLRETLQGYESVIAELQEKLQSVSSENNQQELDSLKQLYQQKLQVISRLTDENQKLNETNSDLEKMKAEFEQNEQYIEQIVQEKATLLKQLDQAQNQVESNTLLQKNKQLMETVTTLEAERRTLKESMDLIIRGLNEDLQKLKIELQETQNQNLQFKAQRDECVEQIKYYEQKLQGEKQQSGGLLTKFAGFFVTESEMKKFVK